MITARHRTHASSRRCVVSSHRMVWARHDWRLACLRHLRRHSRHRTGCIVSVQVSLLWLNGAALNMRLLLRLRKRQRLAW